MKRMVAWKKSPYRKPLILKGVRQVGKTWLLKELGRRYSAESGDGERAADFARQDLAGL